MFRSALLWALKAFFALTILTAPASAVTFISITPSNVAPYLLLPDTVYSYNSPTVPTGGVDDVFKFQYSPPPTFGANSFAAINDGSFFFPATAKWWFNTVDDFSTASLVQSASSPGPGVDINTSLSLAAGAGFYWYEFIGTAGEFGGQYNLSIRTETPLPASVWLLGSVLAGGAGWSKFRRKQKARKAV